MVPRETHQRKNTFAIDRTVGGIQRRPSKIKFISSYRRKEYSEADETKQRFGHRAKIRLSYVRKAITLRNLDVHMFRTRIPRRNFPDHGVSIPLRMLTSSNVRLFVLGGFYYTIVYIIISFLSVLYLIAFTTASLEPSKGCRLSFGLKYSVRVCVCV